MYDISTNSIEPIKRQEKELHIFDDYSEEVSEERQMEESVIETSGDTSGSNTVYLITPNRVFFWQSPITNIDFRIHLHFFAAPSKTHLGQEDKVLLFSMETLATANIITALSALTIGILLGVLISKKCLNPENGLCNRSNTEKPPWQSKKDHNCQFYIQR